MTELDGVNMVLAGIGAAPASALDTGGVSEVAEAENYLAQENKLVQSRGGRGWWFHRVEEYDAELPDSRFVVATTGGSANSTLATFDETITQATSGATGKFKYQITVGATTYWFIKSVSGTFTTGSLELSGASAIRTGSSYTAVTTARHAFPRSFWLYVEPHGSESELFIQPREDYLYNAHHDELTFDWTVDLTLNYIPLIDFEDIPSEAVCEYIARCAAYKYRIYKRQDESAALARLMASAQSKANQEHNRYKRVNVFHGYDGSAVRAALDRTRGYWG